MGAKRTNSGAEESVVEMARAAMTYMTHEADCSIGSDSGIEGRVLCDCGMLKTREDLHEALEAADDDAFIMQWRGRAEIAEADVVTLREDLKRERLLRESFAVALENQEVDD